MLVSESDDKEKVVGLLMVKGVACLTASMRHRGRRGRFE